MEKQAKKQRLSREEKQAQTRQNLLATAYALFITNGYGGTSIRDIADKAGYSQGAFYSNFASKEELLLALLEQHMASEAQQLQALFDIASRTSAEVLAGIDEWASNLSSDIDWYMMSIELQLHAKRSPAFAVAFQCLWDKHRKLLATLIQQLFEKAGKQPPLDAEELATAFIALAHGLAIQKSDDAPNQACHIITLLLRGLVSG